MHWHFVNFGASSMESGRYSQTLAASNAMCIFRPSVESTLVIFRCFILFDFLLTWSGWESTCFCSLRESWITRVALCHATPRHATLPGWRRAELQWKYDITAFIRHWTHILILSCSWAGRIRAFWPAVATEKFFGLIPSGARNETKSLCSLFLINF